MNIHLSDLRPLKHFQSWLAMLSMIGLLGCSTPLQAPHSAGPDAGPDRERLRRLLEGRSPGFGAGGVTLAELPSGFELNPRRASTNSLGTALPTKDVAILMGQWRHGAEEVTVKVTPFVDRRRGPGLWVVHEARDAVEWRVPLRHHEVTLSDAAGDQPRLLVLGADGTALPGFVPGWCWFLAVSGPEGVVGWSGNPADPRLGSPRAGFRRFRIEGPAGSEGWALLRPRVPTVARE